MPFEAEQFLIVRISDRQDQTAALSELHTKRLRHGRRRCRDKNGVKRSKFGQAQRAVTAMNMHIRISEPLQPRSRRGSEAPVY